METSYSDDQIRKETRFEFMTPSGMVIDRFDIPTLVPTIPRGSISGNRLPQPLPVVVTDDGEMAEFIDRVCRIHGMPVCGQERLRSRRASIISDIEAEYVRRGFHYVTTHAPWVNERKPWLFEMSSTELEDLLADLKVASNETTFIESNSMVVKAVHASKDRRREADDARMAHVPPAQLDMNPR